MQLCLKDLPLDLNMSEYANVHSRVLMTCEDAHCTYIGDFLKSSIQKLFSLFCLDDCLNSYLAARAHVSAPTWRVRLIDEQRNEDSRRIVRPCSHLLSVRIVRVC